MYSVLDADNQGHSLCDHSVQLNVFLPSAYHAALRLVTDDLPECTFPVPIVTFSGPLTVNAGTL